MLTTIGPITIYWRERFYTSSRTAKRRIPGPSPLGYCYNVCALVSRTGIGFRGRFRLVVDWIIWREELTC